MESSHAFCDVSRETGNGGFYSPTIKGDIQFKISPIPHFRGICWGRFVTTTNKTTETKKSVDLQLPPSTNSSFFTNQQDYYDNILKFLSLAVVIALLGRRRTIPSVV
eukprot:scaffold11961_cov122-Cylindrotheca_fusiformis.AAC.3